MSCDALHSMLSFGHCIKRGENNIGRYGNGFKSGSMRIGRDVLVLTKDGVSMSAGFLSRTFLDSIFASEVLIPLLTWDVATKSIDGTLGSEITKNSLNIMTQFSPFRSEKELLGQFDLIKSPTGTRIIIFNLRISKNEPECTELELDFDTDPSDIMLRRDATSNVNQEIAFSLKHYCQILYLVPTMRIILRGKRIRTHIASRNLHMTKTCTYKPKEQAQTKVTFGFNLSNKKAYGMLFYCKNRLIEYYIPVGFQTEGSSRGKGVIGVVQADFLQPTHNKQHMMNTPEYVFFKKAMASKLNLYWDSCLSHGGIGNFWADTTNTIDECWIQCDKCLQWRRLAETSDKPSEDGLWFCELNTDPRQRTCGVSFSIDTLVHTKRLVTKPREKKKSTKLNPTAEEEVAVEDATSILKKGIIQSKSKSSQFSICSSDEEEEVESSQKSTTSPGSEEDKGKSHKTKKNKNKVEDKDKDKDKKGCRSGF
eukprot:TRINITY_DN7016_c0_g1_i1.p1 TRINITY_DN7016_c0_g1~~TRINITY_DN7016_c0_g1_i1.p1  ORF type:complete len:550 (-),score=87.70 TRINITY_DN7016_c0_g1_i1:1314-2753(-)